MLLQSIAYGHLGIESEEVSGMGRWKLYRGCKGTNLSTTFPGTREAVHYTHFHDHAVSIPMASTAVQNYGSTGRTI